MNADLTPGPRGAQCSLVCLDRAAGMVGRGHWSGRVLTDVATSYAVNAQELRQQEQPQGAVDRTVLRNHDIHAPGHHRSALPADARARP